MVDRVLEGCPAAPYHGVQTFPARRLDSEREEKRIVTVVLLGDGILGTRGSIMIDFVFLAMFAVVPIMAISIYLAKVRRQLDWHRRIQLILGAVLAVAVTAFELDMRLFTDWQALAAPSPYFQAGSWCLVWVSLAVHLCFAIPTTLLWVFVIVQALRHFPTPITPNAYSVKHIFWARLAALGMLMTAVTGWGFYWLAFVAS